MIEINLTPGERGKSVAVVAGIDFSSINVKYVILFFIAIYAVEPLVDSQYDTEINQKKESTLNLTKQTRNLTSELRKYDAVKEQVEQLEQQQKDLKAKIEIVREIVNKRQNPYSILKYIADNTPENVWVDSLEIKDKKLKIVGYSKSWKSIGKFIENLKDSIFFNGTVDYEKATNLKDEYKRNQVETFQITTGVTSFK